MWKEFREFIAKGNVLDLAVGVIIGAAFGKIISSLVDDIIMPPLGQLLAGIDFRNLKYVLGTKVEGEKVIEVALKYGNFIQTFIEFLIIAFVIFLVVKSFNKFRAAAPPPPPTPSEALLVEIRDLLKR